VRRIRADYQLPSRVAARRGRSFHHPHTMGDDATDAASEHAQNNLVRDIFD